MFSTRTGNFPIGIRRGGSDWQKDLSSLLGWANDCGLSVVDLGRNLDDVQAARQSGFQVGSVDLLQWPMLISSDDAKRKAGVEANILYIQKACQAGATNFFCVMLPEDPKRARRDNFASMVQSLQELAPVLEQAGGQIVIEGWPGEGALCCTPESYRATFEAVPSMSIGINYDPSHLLRMGIDPIRFLKEFAPRVGHVHGKDAEILADDLYEYGHEQPATFKKSPAFGAASWRYTIPGQGGTNWGEVFRVLEHSGYNGAVSIELEDRDFNGTEEGEKAGFLSSAAFLASC
jgi:sugar phosphate isomerase/epimerase